MNEPVRRREEQSRLLGSAESAPTQPEGPSRQAGLNSPGGWSDILNIYGSLKPHEREPGKNDLHYCQRGLPFTSSGGRTEFLWKHNIRLGCRVYVSMRKTRINPLLPAWEAGIRKTNRPTSYARKQEKVPPVPELSGLPTRRIQP